LLCCYWRYALRERGFDLLAVAARDPAADAELIEPPAHALPQPCSRVVLDESVFLICSSEESIDTFIAHCEVAAHDLLMPHGDAVIVLSTVLRIKRTLDGAEIDKILSDLQAEKGLAIERRRRADWRKRELAAKRFLAEKDHADGASLPQVVHDQAE
jgi:hypothetical protein